VILLAHPHPAVYGVSIRYLGVSACRPTGQTEDISECGFSAIPAYCIPLRKCHARRRMLHVVRIGRLWNETIGLRGPPGIERACLVPRV
jgi:hypothetical protein